MVQSFAAVAAPLLFSLIFSGAQAAPQPGTVVGNGRTQPRSPGTQIGNGRRPRAVPGMRMTSYGTYGPHFMQSAATANSSGTEIVGNSQDLLYTVNVTINGQDYPVQIDTGSTDLWIYAPGSIVVNNETDLVVTESYGKGRAKGNIAFVDMELGSYTIKDQAFLNAKQAVDFGFLQSKPPTAYGILGLSFEGEGASPINSAIREADNNENSTRGYSPIASIFAQNPDTPNFFDIALDRLYDLDTESHGTFTIGEHLEGYEKVEEQPKLWRLPVERWSIVVDGLIVNGQSFSWNASSLPEVPAGKAAAVLDTGFSLPPLPPAAVDFIYQSIPGYVKVQDSFPQYAIPCDAAVNVSFIFGGQEYPVHPLDLTLVNAQTMPINGTDTEVTLCYNAYQYLDLDPSAFAGFDMILGDSFLRNVYASFDYGLTDSTGNTSYVQLLSTTDQAKAWEEFPIARAAALKELPTAIPPKVLEQMDETNGSAGSGSGSGAGSGSGSGSGSGGGNKSPSQLSTSGAIDNTGDVNSKVADLLEKYGPIVIGLLAGNVLIGVLLLVLGITMCFRSVVKGGAKTRTISSTYAPVRFKEAESREHDSYHD